MQKTVLVLSDLHVGHRLGVCPPQFIDSDGGTYKANRVQKALFEAWYEVVKAWPKPDILVINGEPIDGQQPKDQGIEAWTTDYGDQMKASIQLVKMFGAKKIYLTRGSNYHVNLGGKSIEELYGERVRAEEVDGRFVSPELFLEVDGVTFNFAHHIAGSLSGWMYRSTPPAKEMMLAQLNQSHKWPFDILIRSHNHYYWAIESASKLAMLTPAWQLQTWYGLRRTSAGSIPDIGAVRFKVGEGRYAYEKMLFKLNEAKPPKVKA